MFLIRYSRILSFKLFFVVFILSPVSGKLTSFRKHIFFFQSHITTLHRFLQYLHHKHSTLFLRQLPKLRLLKFLNGNMSLIRVRIHESLIYILQIVLDLIVRRTDDCLEAKSADQ